MSTSAPNPPGPPALNKTQMTRLASPLVLWPAAIVLAVLLFYALDYLSAGLTHESTDDAFTETHVISISPRIAGQVAAVHVLDNELVRSNELLLEIDPADYAMNTAQKQSVAESQSANYQTILSTYELMKAKVGTAEATARKAQADAEASAATASRAEADFKRAQELRQQNTISLQEFDVRQEAFKTAQANLHSTKENTASELSRVAESRAQLKSAETAVAMALAQWRAAQTNIAAAQLELSYTKIFAPCDGLVTRKAVETGNYVQIGQALLAIVPPEIWVVANFKESQLKKMQAGQPVLVKVDALGKTFRAHVDSLQAGTGARFSLFPPENATGNYVKVVQRVPVKIVFDEPLPAGRSIGPGLSVVPSVQVSSFTLPVWVSALVAIVLAMAAALGFRLVLRRKLNRAGA